MTPKPTLQLESGASAHAAPDGIDPQDFFLPVVLAVVQVLPEYLRI
jgi:hypothetical protein